MVSRSTIFNLLVVGLLTSACADSITAPTPPAPPPFVQSEYRKYPHSWTCNLYDPASVKRVLGIDCVCPDGPFGVCYAADEYPF